MASFTLNNTPFPDGTSVSAYDATGYATFPAFGPPGSAIATASVSAGSLTFTGLTNHTSYFAAAKVGGVWHSWRFTPGEDAPPPSVPDDIDYAGLSAGQALVVNEDGDGYEFATVASDTTVGVLLKTYFDQVGTLYASASAALQAAINTGKKVFILPPEGEYGIEGVTAEGPISILGDSQRKCILHSPSGKPMLTITGNLGSKDGVRLKGFMVTSSSDGSYAEPLIKLTKLRESEVDIDAEITGIGTLICFDTTYNSTAKGNWRTNRFCIPFEVCNVATEQQMDTIEIVAHINGTHGPIIRTATGGLHGINFRHVKHVVSPPDWGQYKESKLNAEAKAGATSLVLAAGGGAKFSAGQPIYYGKGDTVEINKISSVEGDTLKLTKATRYAQPSGEQVVYGGFCGSIGTATGIVLDTVHFEGAATGLMTCTTNGIATVGACFSAVGEFIRITGQTQDIDLGIIEMGGVEERNNLIYVNAGGANWHRPKLRFPLVLHSGSPAPAAFAGESANAHIYEMAFSQSGYPFVLKNVPSGQGSQRHIELSVAGAETYTQFYDGSERWNGSGGPKQLYGSGSPEGAVEAPPGSTYRRTDGGSGTAFYVKQTGIGKTGWKAVQEDKSVGSRVLTDLARAGGWRRTNAIAETVSKRLCTSASVSNALKEQLKMIGGIVVPGGRAVSSVTVLAGSTAGAELTHSFVAIYKASNRELLATTEDITTAAWAKETERTWNIATALRGETGGGTWTPEEEIEVYVGLVVVGVTMPNLYGVSAGGAISGFEPFLLGRSTNAIKTLADIPTTAAAITAESGTAYAYVK